MDELEEKISKILEEKLPEILSKTEEIKKQKEELEKKRIEYVRRIWKYFPGAKTKELSFQEVKEIAEKLDELAKKVKYTPIKPKQAQTKFFGGKGKKRRIATIIVLLAVLIGAAISKFIVGW